ncbi:L-serine ammonia-lyase [Boudabousia liubingyangii]|uniref:L-serine dehydratase n=1 Tax=Boudabousia liubingyangii TaxID=1921764 RepID=A0A1Q5PPJ6_9ACTO|nr:L-serine ammonia-lyase [Boudabousia liubingyangii]OKL49442.1 L-serine ammonia-lyase [Boudabousia liubingyangii]
MDIKTSQFTLPADLISGEAAPDADARPLSVFDMFRVGIGPSSSHTVGPMRAGLAFAQELEGLLSEQPGELSKLEVELYGSLAATGRGHSTDRAVLMGLAGYDPQTVPASVVTDLFGQILESGVQPLLGEHQVPFTYAEDLKFLPSTVLPYHVNGLKITVFGADQQPLLSRIYYSVGGGFVMKQVNEDPQEPEVEGLAVAAAAEVAGVPAPYPFSTARELLAHCLDAKLSIAEVVRANEVSARTEAEVDEYLDYIHQAMSDCVDAGCNADGELPGGLRVRRRASYMADRLSRRMGKHREGTRWAATSDDPMRAMDWVNLYALAVNEENAAGHRVVTAPTNGAAGVIPAVLCYLEYFCPEGRVYCDDPACPACTEQARSDKQVVAPAPAEGVDSLGPTPMEDASLTMQRVKRADCRGHVNVPAIRDFLLAATAVGALIKTNASIAGAEVGCQGEVGSASAMAAAGLAQALGGTPQQVENAAEIAMEHNLGLTCDPVGGLVQVPCIERNAIAAVKAINAARMAMWGDGRHTVSLDAAIETMWQTGKDMMSKYKETSMGGLAVNVVEC